MNNSVKINKREVIEIFSLWTFISLISSLSYSTSFMLPFILFMLPALVYLGITYKHGSRYLLDMIVNNELINGAFELINKLLKITDIKKDTTAPGKSRLMIISILLLFIVLSLISPTPSGLKLGYIILYPPLFYIIFRGYRLAFITLIALNTIDIINFFINTSVSHNIKLTLVTTILFIVLSIIYTYALYVENVRINLEKQGRITPQKNHATRDTIITFSLYALCITIILILA